MTLRLELVDALKRLIKARGLTYADVAGRIDISEASVKRWFSQADMTLEKLESICVAIGCDLQELLEFSRTEKPPVSELTEEQEEALVADPKLFLALYLAINRFNEDDVLSRYRFTKPEWTLLLTKLDRLGIVELQPMNKVRLRTARNFRWRTGGPIEQLFARQLLPEFFAQPFTGDDDKLVLLAGSVSDPTAGLMKQRLEDLAREFDLLLARDTSLPSKERVGVSLVLAMRPWRLKAFDKIRKDDA